MLKLEGGQDPCGWREMLFRFQIWQHLVIDSVKERKTVCNPLYLLMRAGPANHRA